MGQQQMQQQLPLGAQQALAEAAAASLLPLLSSPTLGQQGTLQLQPHLALAPLLVRQHQAQPTQQTQATPPCLQAV
jgi:hypothetical protein